jgi:hypothetical protein
LQLLEIAYGSKLAETALLLEHAMRDASFALLGAAPPSEHVEAANEHVEAANNLISRFNHSISVALKGAVVKILDVLAPGSAAQLTSEQMARARDLGENAATKMLARIADPHDPTATFGPYSLLQKGISEETKRHIKAELQVEGLIQRRPAGKDARK